MPQVISQSILRRLGVVNESDLVSRQGDSWPEQCVTVSQPITTNHETRTKREEMYRVRVTLRSQARDVEMQKTVLPIIVNIQL